MTAPIIGIDLGTTHTCCAVANAQGVVTLIPYRDKSHAMPSLFAIDAAGRELVGLAAKEQWQHNTQHTVYGVKRLLGASFDSEVVERTRRCVAYQIQEGNRGEVLIPIGKQHFRVPEIQAKILAKVRDAASAFVGVPITQAVVTVPAYYNDRQRQAVRRAGVLANLDIVQIINEPTAAALAYGASGDYEQTIAVYDLGGGTFDMSVIAIRKHTFEVLATGGDTSLGGLDFDNALVEYILSDFQAQHHVDLSCDPQAVQKVRAAAEQAKIELSSRPQANVRIASIARQSGGQALELNMDIRRDDLHMLVEHLAERTFDTCGDVLTRAKLGPEDLDAFIVVGGQTHMPLIAERLAGFFGRAPSGRVRPDQAVAIGAALYAHSLGDRSRIKYQLRDVLPMAIGIEGVDGKCHRLFERNSSVPNRRQFDFTTHRDNQKDLAMRLFQGDFELAKQNTLLGEFTFSGLRAGPAGSVRVEVVFDVSSEGILALTAKDCDTGQQMQHTVRFGQ